MPKPGIKKGNVVAMPGRSWQGSRRRFWLGRSGAQFELQVELHEQVLVFAVHGRLPNRNHSVVKAQLQQQGNRMYNNVDEGTCEIVEGSMQKGHLRLYFAGNKIKGQWIFDRTGDVWNVGKG